MSSESGLPPLAEALGNLTPEGLQAFLARPDVAFCLAHPDVADRLEMERSLYRFVLAAWDIVESQPFIPNWHIRLVCEHLQAVTEGAIDNLLINIPPGCSKSLLTCVFWPMWEWARNPSVRWFFASYDIRLSRRDSVKCRKLLQSSWFQERWGDKVKLRGDQNQKEYYETEAGGYRLATSTTGHGLGEHPDRIVVDDPHNVKAVESEAERTSFLEWWDLTMSTRGVARGVRRVIIMQRLDFRDLSAHVLKTGRYVHVCLPMYYEPGRMKPTPLAGNPRTAEWAQDPRTEPGELLAPKQFPPEKLVTVEESLRAFGIAGQFQQRPVPKGGALFKGEWFRYFTKQPGAFSLLPPKGSSQSVRVEPRQGCRWFATMDPAGGTSSDADFTAIAVWAITARNDLLLVDVRKDRVAVEGIVPFLAGVCEDYPQLLFVSVESLFLNKQLVIDPAQQRRGLPPIKPVRPRGEGGKKKLVDKYVHALPALYAVESGKVFFREDARWLEEVEAELLSFTGRGDTHDDVVDCISYAVDEWRAGTLTAGERLEAFEGTGFPRRPQHDGFRRDGLAGPMGGGFPRAPGAGGFRRG